MFVYSGYWDDNSCTATMNALCESEAARAKAGPFTLAAGEARYFELLHVHNETMAANNVGPVLGLELEISNETNTWTTRVSGAHSLSMEFFRELATIPSISVAVGATPTTALASSCASPEACAFTYSEDATPTISAVSPTRGVGGDHLFVYGTNLPVATIGDVSVGIGGASCDVVSNNGTVLECVLAKDQAQAGTYPVSVRVDGLGNAAFKTEAVVNFTVELAVYDFSPRNGSVLGGDILQIWGTGFSRLGVQNKITIGDDIECIPRTLKNRACRVSEFDSGYRCAWTVNDWYGYPMVANAYATSNVRAHAEWFDFSNTTYIECVIQDRPDAKPLPNGSSWPVTVSLLSEADLVDGDVLVQEYTDRRAVELEYATRNLDCHVLLGYRIWNVGLSITAENATDVSRKDCVLWNEEYDVVGVYAQSFVYNGSSATSEANYTFLIDATPLIESIDSSGMAGQEITIVGKNLEATVEEWNLNWYMDEFGFYTQPETPVIFIGSSPAVLTFANATVVKFLPTYNVPEVKHPVLVWVLGRGRAIGNKNFTYVHYLYDVSPNIGSIEGGTAVTLIGSGFATTHAFYASNGASMGSSVGDHVVTLPSGADCVVQSATETTIQCVTERLSNVNVTSGIVEVEVLWNYEPFYFACAVANCTPPGCLQERSACKFSYSTLATPHLELRTGLLLDGKPYVIPGNEVVFDVLTDYNFDWTEVDASMVAVSLGNITCQDVVLSHQINSTLHCILPEDSIPQGEDPVFATILVAGYGYARIENNGVMVRPVIKKISANHGSLAGGLNLSIAGRGFAAGVDYVVVASTTFCEKVIVHSASLLSCTTASVKATPSDWIVQGDVYVVANATVSACEAASSCNFSFVGNSIAVTPIVTNVSVTDATLRAESKQPVTVTGKGFAPADNVVLFGYESCVVVSENETMITCTLPTHPAGLYRITVNVPGKGNSAGFNLWIRFGFDVDAVHVVGSRYGGQTIAITGSGFPTCRSADYDAHSRDTPALTCTDAVLTAACDWTTYNDGVTMSVTISTIDGEYFAGDVVSSTHSTLALVSTLRGYDGVDANADSGVVQIKVGQTTQLTSSILSLSSSNLVSTSLFNGNQQWRLFDGNNKRYWFVQWSGYDYATLTYDFGSATALGEYGFYIHGYESCPISWVLVGSEEGTEWVELDKYFYNTTSDSCSKVWRSSTVQKPGFYRYYQWQIKDVYSGDVDSPLWIGQMRAYAPEYKSQKVSYTRSDAYTPNVISVSPPSGGFRQVLAIRGSWVIQSSKAADDLAVRVGGQPCPIHWANSTYLECASPNASAGYYPVTVTSSTYGLAGPVPPLDYEVELDIWNMTQSAGSLAGGTVVTFTGFGFADEASDNLISISGAACETLDTYEYFFESLEPTFEPTHVPTSAPTDLPTLSLAPTAFPSPAPTACPSGGPSPVPSNAPSQLPVEYPTGLPSESPTSAPTAQPATPTSIPTSLPTSTPAPVVSLVPTSFPSMPTSLPSFWPTTLPSPLPTPMPTGLQTESPTTTPASAPTPSPTVHPTAMPTQTTTTVDPTAMPTPSPTLLPSPLPTPMPQTGTPTSVPTASPTLSMLPTVIPTTGPTGSMIAPSHIPTACPTEIPSFSPTTSEPTAAPTQMPTAAPTVSPTVSPSSTFRPTASMPPTRVPTPRPTDVPTSFPTTTPTPLPTTSAPTINATQFPGFDYFATLQCRTGALPNNVTELVSAEAKIGTRLRTNERLVLHSGRKGYSSYGDKSFIAVSTEPYCRSRKLLLELTSAGIAFAFYSPSKRDLVDYQTYTYTLTTSRSKAAADFIASYASRDDLLLVVITSYNLFLESTSELLSAIKTCGGSSLLHSLPSSSGNYLYGNYALVARCTDQNGAQPLAGYSANLGLEVSNDYAADIEIDVDDYFFFTNGMYKTGFNFTYDPALTPVVFAMSRLNGTTAGGTTLSLNVSNLPTHLQSNVSVTLGGVKCATTYADIGSYRGLHLCAWEGVDCSSIGFEKIDNNVTQVTCLTNPWDYSGDAKEAAVVVTAGPYGNARVENGIVWSYIDLWSSVTTWGGNRDNIPDVGDSVTITQGQYIVLDVSPPSLFLLIVYGGVLEFSPDVGDLQLNASYIFVFGGKFIVGTETEPFPNKAVITLEGDRNSYELPVYGAKCLAVRDAILDLHGLPSTAGTWVRLAENAFAGNNTLILDTPVDWSSGDHIFVTSTSFDPLETEELYIEEVLDGGYTLRLKTILYFDHWGLGYVDPVTGEELVPEYRAEVGRLTRNVVVQGDDTFSKRQQFGAQIIFASSQTYDNSIIGRLSNIEVRQAGQGLKLGKYPIHFHMVGKVDKSYVTNCSIHHANNRAVAIHGISHLRVLGNVVFDTRGTYN